MNAVMKTTNKKILDLDGLGSIFRFYQSKSLLKTAFMFLCDAELLYILNHSVGLKLKSTDLG